MDETPSEFNVLDDPFSPCAFAAFVIEARKVGGWPNSEEVRKTAYKLFEDGKKMKNNQTRDSVG